MKFGSILIFLLPVGRLDCSFCRWYLEFPFRFGGTCLEAWISIFSRQLEHLACGFEFCLLPAQPSYELALSEYLDILDSAFNFTVLENSNSGWSYFGKATLITEESIICGFKFKSDPRMALSTAAAIFANFLRRK